MRLSQWGIGTFISWEQENKCLNMKATGEQRQLGGTGNTGIKILRNRGTKRYIPREQENNRYYLEGVIN